VTSDYEKLLSDISRLPLKARRKTLRFLWRTLRVTGNLPVLGLENILKYALHLSTAEAKQTEEEIVFQDWIVTADWAAIINCDRQALERDGRMISVPDRDLLQEASQEGKPLIFAPLHMGCFPLAFAKIMRDHFMGRRMLILRAREDRPEETLAMQRVSELGVDMRFLNIHDKQNYFDAVRFGKEGAIIVMFVDLPASYGGAVGVNLFGKPIRLAMGIGSLARLAGATVIPLSVSSSVNGDVVNIGRAFETYEKGPDEKARVVSLVKRHIEESIRLNPAQWHMWPRFGEFVDTAPQGVV